METLQRLHNRGSISTGEYEIDNSCKLESNNTEYLHRTVSSAGNRDIGTVSCWVKRTELEGHMYLFTFGDTDNDTGRTYIKFQNTDTLRVGGGSTLWRETNRVFRDTSAWYHVVVAFDTSQSTANDRIKIYVNGVQETSFSTTNNPSQNDDLGINFEKQTVGYNSIDNDSPFNGYITEICYQDGTASAASDFGEFDSDTGIWKPKDVSGVASGTNGFYLDFEDSSNMGNDVSGGTDFTENNITSADQATDTPTNNFCIQSSVISFTAREPVTTFAVNGGTSSSDTSSNNWRGVMCTMGVTAGKWYWEVKNQWSTNGLAGIHTFRGNTGTTTSPHAVNDSFYFVYNKSGSGAHMAKYIDGTATNPVGSYETAFNHNDYACFSLDLDNDTLTVTQNGSSAGTNLTDVDISSITALGPVAPLMVIYRYSMRTIFGGFSTDALTSPYQDENGYGNFKYAVPSGYYAICSKNLAEYG